ncbi:unnamed protein product [Gordionus sp. m RMFG-2023]
MPMTNRQSDEEDCMTFEGLKHNKYIDEENFLDSKDEDLKDSLRLLNIPCQKNNIENKTIWSIISKKISKNNNCDLNCKVIDNLNSKNKLLKSDNEIIDKNLKCKKEYVLSDSSISPDIDKDLNSIYTDVFDEQLDENFNLLSNSNENRISTKFNIASEYINISSKPNSDENKKWYQKFRGTSNNPVNNFNSFNISNHVDIIKDDNFIKATIISENKDGHNNNKNGKLSRKFSAPPSFNFLTNSSTSKSSFSQSNFKGKSSYQCAQDSLCSDIKNGYDFDNINNSASKNKKINKTYSTLHEENLSLISFD